MRKLQRQFSCTLCLVGLLLALAFHNLIPVRSLQTPASLATGTPSLPTIVQNGVKVPDWQHIAFSTLPALVSGGSFSAPAQLIQFLGYDPSRIWNAGDPIEQILSLGDLQEAFGLEKFKLDEILRLVGAAKSLFNLADMGVLQWQSIADMVQAVGLQDLLINQVKPIADLLILNGYNSLNQTLGDLIADPVLGALKLGQLDLTKYALDAIPGLGGTQLKNFTNWQPALVSQIPGLKDVSFANFPNSPLTDTSLPVAIVDMIYGPAEAQRLNTISGSHQVGFGVPCERDSCAYIELSEPLGLGNFSPLHGKQWISGRSQQVRGGTGLFSGGKEPTGRHPWGKGFKVVLTDTTEQQGEAQFGIYFRKCFPHPWGCTPYFIGPLPWFPVQEKDIVILGF